MDDRIFAKVTHRNSKRVAIWFYKMGKRQEKSLGSLGMELDTWAQFKRVFENHPDFVVIEAAPPMPLTRLILTSLGVK